MHDPWRCVTLIVLLLNTLGATVHAQEVIRIPEQSQLTQSNLATRWNWAVQEATARKFQQGYWVGYSFVRLMREDSFYGVFHSVSNGQKTLEEIIFGTTGQSYTKESDRPTAPSARYRMVQKDIAVLFRFHPHVRSGNRPESISASNIGLRFDLQGLPIIWIGKTGDEESVDLLLAEYRNSNAIDFKSRVLEIIGWHKPTEQARSLLQGVLKGQEAERLRKKAALHLGNFEDDEVLGLLEASATADRSTGVAESAVMAISCMKTDAALDVLIGLAKHAERDGVRKRAIHSLSRYASEKVAPTLQDVIENSKNLGFQKQAIYALTRIKGRDNIPQLISFAQTHPNNEIRKYAIYMLGQSKDRRALDALIEMVKK